MKNLMNLSKKLDVLFKVLQRISVIGMSAAILATLILSIVNFFNPDAIIGEGFCSVDIGSVTIELSENLAPDNGTILTYVWLILLAGAVSMAVVYYAFGLVRKILQPMSEGKPFDASISRNIRKISYAVLVFGIIQNIASAIEAGAAVWAFSLAHLTEGGAVRSITANYTVSLGFLAVFFVLLLVSHIFRYGAELQQLSDETL